MKFKILTIVLLLQVVQAQTLKQKTFSKNYWRLTKTVTHTEINRDVFNQCNSGIQVTYEDQSLNKTIQIKFVTDEKWKRIMYGDYKKWIKAYGSYGEGPGQFIMPTKISFVSYNVNGVQRNELFILDKLSGSIKVLKVNFRFSGTGGSKDTDIEYITSIDDFAMVEDMTTYYIDGVPYLVVSETGKDRIGFYDLSTGSYTFKNFYGSTGNSGGQFSFPMQIAVSSNIYYGPLIMVNDYANKRLVRLTPSRNPDGTISVVWHSTMPYSTDISSMDTDLWGNIFVTGANHRIRKYSPTFEFLAEFGTSMTGQVENAILWPKNINIGRYVLKTSAGSYNSYKSDIAFLTEDWTDYTGGAIYDLGTSIPWLQVTTYGNDMAGTQIQYFVTDMSKYDLTISEQLNGVWSQVRKYGNLTDVVYPGQNTIIWDGNGLELSRNFKFVMQIKEAYNDTDALTMASEAYVYAPLSAYISGPSQVSYQGASATVSAVVYGGSGSYSYDWNFGLSNGSSHTFNVMNNPTTVYLTVSSGGQSVTGSKSIYIQGYGGCPFVFANTSQGFQTDNNILHRAEMAKASGQNITDLYKLNVRPEKMGDEYQLQIKELNNDHSYFDKFKLLAIDHDADEEIGVTEFNDFVKYKRAGLQSADKVIVNGKEFLIDQISSLSGVKGDKMEIKFSDAKIDLIKSSLKESSHLVLALDLKRNPLLLPPPKDPGGALAYRFTGDEGLAKENESSIVFQRRENSNVVLIPVMDLENLDKIGINWGRDYEIGSIALVAVERVSDKYEMPLKSSTHSKFGSVMDRLTETDTYYAELDSGDVINLNFSAEFDPYEGKTRDFVLETVGHYFVPETDASTILPKEFSLSQNYPNPFNPTTTIKYTLKDEAKVTLKIYNVLGEEVATLVNRKESAGFKEISWNGKNNRGIQVGSGIYFYRIEAGNFVKSKKMLLLK